MIELDPEHQENHHGEEDDEDEKSDERDEYKVGMNDLILMTTHNDENSDGIGIRRTNFVGIIYTLDDDEDENGDGRDECRVGMNDLILMTAYGHQEPTPARIHTRVAYNTYKFILQYKKTTKLIQQCMHTSYLLCFVCLRIFRCVSISSIYPVSTSRSVGR